MNKLYQQFTEFFEQHKWNYHQYGEKPVLHTHFFGDSGRWVGVAVEVVSVGWSYRNQVLLKPIVRPVFSAS